MLVQKQAIITPLEEGDVGYFAEAFSSPEGVEMVSAGDPNDPTICANPTEGDGFVIEYDDSIEADVVGYYEGWAETLHYKLEWQDYRP